MLKYTRKLSLHMGAVFTATMVVGMSDAHANNFGNIAANISTSINQLPGLITGLAYLFGLLLGVLGIMKIKDHVENPGQTPLKDGAIRLAAGGALFALPIIFEAMSQTVDAGGAGAGASAQTLTGVSFAVN